MAPRMEIPTFLCLLLQGLTTLVGRNFPTVCREFPLRQLVSLASCQEPSSSPQPPPRLLQRAARSPLPLSCRTPQLSASPRTSQAPAPTSLVAPLGSLPSVIACLGFREPQTRLRAQTWSLKRQQRGKPTSLKLLAALSLLESGMQSAFAAESTSNSWISYRRGM